jgi:hypothetical protein
LHAKIDLGSLLQQSILKLLDYCIVNNWAGFDPYDGLNSKMFRAIPFAQNRIGRLIFTQAMKRSPINFRPILLIPKAENPKALALFCSTLLILSKMGLFKNDDIVFRLLKRMIELKSPGRPYYCWGYHFDWQARDGFLPKFDPNIICTTFAGNALLDAYDHFSNDQYLEIATNAGDFLLNGLNITKNNDEMCFSYTPLEWSQVHNANLLGAAFLSRLYSVTQEMKFLESAESAVRFSIRRQHKNGSWPYGEDKTQKWIDNFHTGYNLVALKRFSEYAENTDVAETIKKGWQFYKGNFFTEDGVPKYYHNQTYPIDIHAIAYSIVTLAEFKAFDRDNIDLATRIVGWSLKTMRSEDGHFFYQKKRFYVNKIPYMRWSQAWMLYAMSVLAKHCITETKTGEG